MSNPRWVVSCLPVTDSRSRRCSVGWLACCLVLVATSTACTGVSGETTPSSRRAPVIFRVLQANLCDSGIAGCYTGRAVAEAVAVLRAERPDIVTLNEVCRADVSVLQHALSDTEHGSVVASAFKSAVQPGTSDPVRCRNGQRYGIGVLARLRTPDRGYTTFGARYPAQDPADTEERVWLCLDAVADFYACTTHLTNTNRAVALSQCRYLMGTAIPAVRTSNRNGPVILGADLNLGNGRSPNVESCVPPGLVRTDDGGTQYIVVSASLAITATRSIDMHGTTDHPSLLADLASDSRN